MIDPADAAGATAPLNPDARRRTFEQKWRTSLTELYDIKYALDQSAIVAITAARGAISYVNEKFCEISQYSKEELLGQDHRMVSSGYHPKEFIRGLWKTIAAGRIWKGEIRNRAKDGSLYWVDTTIVPFLDAAGKPYQYLAIRFDITDRKRAEANLREQATLTRLGTMAAVVAHEVKNPLAGISGALQIIGSRMPDGNDRAIIDDIQDRIVSLNEMVQDLLVFARPKAPSLVSADIRALLVSTAAVLGRDSNAADVLVEISGDSPVQLVDSKQLQIVFLNLLLNASQAMGGNGQIDVAVRRGQSSCAVEIAYRGPGLTFEVSEKMFEPFFTTKHRGSGLGLPTARRIVEAHGGELTAGPRPGGGAIITVSLPVGRP